MTIFQAIILGIVEGVTEFLPVSSTGHLILAEHLLRIPSSEFLKSFGIFIQLGAILAVVWLYFSKIIKSKKLWLPILIAFLPTGIMGALSYSFIKSHLLDSTQVTVLSLFFGGIALLLLDRFFNKQSATHSVKTLSPLRLSLIGVFQSLAFIPGVSRSAASIIGGLSVGLDRTASVEFSFLLAVPTMVIATGYDLLKSNLTFSPDSLVLLLVGFLVSFITAIVAIKSFLSFVTKRGFAPFAYYRIIIALLLFLFLK